jgi:hypothetical protein
LKIPKYIKQKINKSISLASEIRKLHHEISMWLDKNGIETGENRFTDEVWDEFSHGEIHSVDEFEELLNRYIEETQ